MKKIMFMLAMLALVIGCVFALDMSGGIELNTNILLDTGDMDKSVYFTDPKYWDAEVNFGVQSNLFGAYLAISSDRTGTQDGITLRDTNVWVKLGSLSKITIGDFTTSAANWFIDFIDVYDLGILQYKVYSAWRGIEVLKSDELGNLVVDFYLGPVTLELSWLKPYLPSASKPTLNYGGRVFGNVAGFVDISLTAVYKDTDTNKPDTENTIIGTSLGFRNLIPNTLDLLVGYTANIRTFSGDIVFDHGIDLRAAMYFGDIVFGTHNNLSLYGIKQMVVYNEVKSSMFLTDALATSLAVASRYYFDGVVPENSVYNLDIYLDFDYNIGSSAVISTGVYIFGIANKSNYETGIDGKAKGIVIGIPIGIQVWFD